MTEKRESIEAWAIEARGEVFGHLVFATKIQAQRKCNRLRKLIPSVDIRVVKVRVEVINDF